MNASLFSSIKFKLMFFVTLCVSASLLICGGYFFNKISSALTQLQVDQLSSEVRIVSPLFVFAFKEMKTDLSVISGTPPIQGIIRSTKNGGVDPKDGSTTELWRARLGNIFTATIKNKPDYTQIRYIGIGDAGREIVRVNKDGDDSHVVEAENLQSKEDEAYFKKALTLSPGEIYFSAVSLNRENGKIQTPYLPVIRGVLPVHDDDGKLFGMIVINASYGSILSSVFDSLQIEKDLYVINDAGDYVLYHNEGDGETTFVFKSLVQQGADSASPVAKILDSPEIEGTLFDQVDDKNVVIQYYKENGVFEDVNRYLAFAVISPRDSFMAPIREAEHEVFLVIVFSVLACVVVALFLSSSIINPLVLMNRKILEYEDNMETKGGDKQLTGLPVDLKNEIGSLARSFVALLRKISKARKDEHAALLLLEEVNTELEEFTYRTSHDLRSPLTSSIGLLNVTEEALEGGDADRAKKSIAFALSSLTKLEVLLQDILELGRVKNVDEPIQEIEIKELVDDSLEKFAHMENFERLEIQVDLKHKQKVYAKKTRIRMIVENLISNAVKYQDVEKKKSFVRIETVEIGGHVVFAVEDNGIGIPADQRDSMFEMFKRFHPKVSFGSGLGMYMMKKSADIIGARIHYKDTETGSRFELILSAKEKTDIDKNADDE